LLDSAIFENATFTNCNFTYATGYYANFFDSKFYGCTISKVTLKNSSFKNSAFDKGSFKGSYLYETNFTSASFIEVDFTENFLISCNFVDSSSRLYTRFTRCNFTENSWHRLTLDDPFFISCILKGVKTYHCNSRFATKTYIETILGKDVILVNFQEVNAPNISKKTTISTTSSSYNIAPLLLCRDISKLSEVNYADL
jgi:uncharacterized protein YjbI with pentapeptide repeats